MRYTFQAIMLAGPRVCYCTNHRGEDTPRPTPRLGDVLCGVESDSRVNVYVWGLRGTVAAFADFTQWWRHYAQGKASYDLIRRTLNGI